MVPGGLYEFTGTYNGEEASSLAMVISTTNEEGEGPMVVWVFSIEAPLLIKNISDINGHLGLDDDFDEVNVDRVYPTGALRYHR